MQTLTPEIYQQLPEACSDSFLFLTCFIREEMFPFHMLKPDRKAAVTNLKEKGKKYSKHLHQSHAVEQIQSDCRIPNYFTETTGQNLVAAKN